MSGFNYFGNSKKKINKQSIPEIIDNKQVVNNRKTIDILNKKINSVESDKKNFTSFNIEFDKKIENQNKLILNNELEYLDHLEKLNKKIDQMDKKFNIEMNVITKKLNEKSDEPENLSFNEELEELQQAFNLQEIKISAQNTKINKMVVLLNKLKSNDDKK